MKLSDRTILQCIADYRAGDASAGDRLLRHLQPWLRELAGRELESRFRRKLDPSDVVQATMVEAVRGLPAFRGQSPEQLSAWLRRILMRALGHEVRRYARVRKRAIDCEQELPAGAGGWDELVAASQLSPRTAALQREEREQLAAALERLPPDYREVIVLRHFEGLTHEQIAARMGRRPGAVRMLWARALAELRRGSRWSR